MVQVISRSVSLKFHQVLLVCRMSCKLANGILLLTLFLLLIEPIPISSSVCMYMIGEDNGESFNDLKVHVFTFKNKLECDMVTDESATFEPTRGATTNVWGSGCRRRGKRTLRLECAMAYVSRCHLVLVMRTGMRYGDQKRI